MDKNRNTPLTWARKSENQELINFLLEKGAIDRAPKKSRPDTKKR
jgi:ankyrin repeat protein